MAIEPTVGSFLLDYELEPADLTELIAADRDRRIRRTWFIVGLVSWLVIASSVTAATWPLIAHRPRVLRAPHLGCM